MLPMSAASWEEELRRVLAGRHAVTTAEVEGSIVTLHEIALSLVALSSPIISLLNVLPVRPVVLDTQPLLMPASTVEALCWGLDIILLPEASAFVRHTALEMLEGK